VTAFPLLDEWLPANSVLERPQMILATVSPDGGPDSRTVLLTEFDDDGLYFHTDSRSRKVADLAANPAVALTFLWPNFTRQLVVRGLASVASPAEQESAFEARSPYLKQLAWLNSPEFAQLQLSERVERWASFDVPDAPPETWIGFVVKPTRLTFWQSNPETASRRDEYTLVDGTWVLGRLPG
jgi:pyridoxamine 5'-phosphate oxidase